MSIKTRSVSFVVISLVLGCAIFVLRAQNKTPNPDKENASSQSPQVKEDTSYYPIVDVAAPDPINSEERIRRDAIGKKYDEAVMPITEAQTTIFSYGNRANSLSALPVEKSDLIVIGEVTGAQAYLSKDRTGVYSAFKIHIDEVLKADANLETAVGSSLTADRPGGRVRFPSGHITLSLVNGQSMPLVGERYVFFLASDETQTNFDLLTGYQLKGDYVGLLDSPSGHPMTKYNGANIETFLNELRAAIKKSPQVGTAR